MSRSSQTTVASHLVRACLALLLAGGALAAQDDPSAATQDGSVVTPADAAGEPAAAVRSRPDPRTRSEERLLTLTSGQILRATARWRGDHWEWRRQGSWESLPPGAVVADREADDAARDWRRLRKDIPAKDVDGRAALCASALEQGLVEEAVAELDRLLGEDPDDPVVLALLRAHERPTLVPTWEPFAADPDLARAGLVEHGARVSRSVQELVIRELDTLHGLQRDALRHDLVAALVDPDHGRRLFATRALRRLFPEAAADEARDELVRRALLDKVDDIRADAGLALRDAGADAALEPLVEALGHGHPLVRMHAAQALGTVGAPAAVPPLMGLLGALQPSDGGRPSGTFFAGRQISYVQGYDTEIATGAAAASPRIGVIQEGATLNATVLGARYSSIYTDETRAIRDSLAGLTGARVTDSNTAWKRWWKKDGEAWVAEHLAPAASVDEELPAGG